MEQLAAPLAEQEPKAEDGGSGGSGLGNRAKFESLLRVGGAIEL